MPVEGTVVQATSVIDAPGRLSARFFPALGARWVHVFWHVCFFKRRWFDAGAGAPIFSPPLALGLDQELASPEMGRVGFVRSVRVTRTAQLRLHSSAATWLFHVLAEGRGEMVDLDAGGRPSQHLAGGPISLSTGGGATRVERATVHRTAIVDASKKLPRLPRLFRGKVGLVVMGLWRCREFFEVIRERLDAGVCVCVCVCACALRASRLSLS